jgi:tRNA-dihydrouridine synthase B
MFMSTFNICGVSLNGRAVLAPMAGAADSAFRLTAKTHGASLVFTELVSSDGLIRNSRKTCRLMEFLPEERPVGIQLFGCHAETMSHAAALAEELKPDFIDLNFGCPSRKIVKRGMGAAVMKDIEHLCAVEAAQAAERAGARLVTVHPRTQSQGFSGKADWQWIARVKSAVSIPVIGNGDVENPDDARRMLDETGCDLVMIGRGSLGRPWIFSQINRLLETNMREEEPSREEKIGTCLVHFKKAVELLGEKRGVFEMRKHIGWYVKGMHGNAEFRKRVFSLTERASVEEALQAFTCPA